MAINPVTLRLAFMLTLFGWRAVQGPAVANWDSAYKSLRSRLLDPDESDEDLSAAVSDAIGYPATVATFSGAFECRRVQINWEVVAASLVDEDVRVCTMHLLKTSGGTPVDTWDGADFTAAQTALLAWWGSIKSIYGDETKLVSLKFYREGPGVSPPQPPVYEHVPATPIAGSTVTGFNLPPQCAISITEKTSIRRSWGRMYLPAPDYAALAVDGRIATTRMTTIADATDTLYEALVTANLTPVVYRRPLPARDDADGDELPAREASALTVDQLQIDDLFDVVRSRRWERPNLRIQRAVGS